jgi:hypothetical protein
MNAKLLASHFSYLSKGVYIVKGEGDIKAIELYMQDLS